MFSVCTPHRKIYFFRYRGRAAIFYQFIVKNDVTHGTIQPEFFICCRSNQDSCMLSTPTRSPRSSVSVKLPTLHVPARPGEMQAVPRGARADTYLAARPPARNLSICSNSLSTNILSLLFRGTRLVIPEKYARPLNHAQTLPLVPRRARRGVRASVYPFLHPCLRTHGEIRD